jgi:hypothetical protein
MSNFFGGKRGCPHGFKQRLFSDNNIPVSGFGGVKASAKTLSSYFVVFAYIAYNLAQS